MRVLDANLLLYGYDARSPFHQTARMWLERVFSSGEPVGLPWQSIMAFLRVITNPRLPGDRLSMERAAALVENWLARPNVVVMSPGERHWILLKQMMLEGQARGPMLTDAQLAALTVEYGGILCTTDRDFARFPGLRWMNPLA